MTNQTHLSALELRLSHERQYLNNAKSDHEKELRAVWIKQIEKEIKGERDCLGLGAEIECDMTDDELLAELTA